MFNPSIVFLAFANDEKDFLTSLKEESKVVSRALEQVEKKYGSIQIKREESAENNDISYYLASYKDRITVFHYAGHADGKQLSFEGETGNSQGLARLLSLQKNLRLVFLNACATKEQADLYIQAGVKAVIATDLPIIDPHAKVFSETFYTALANNHTLEEAYLLAAGVIKLKYENYKDSKDEIIYYDTRVEKEDKNSEEIEAALEIEDVEVINNTHHIYRKLGKRNRNQPKEKIMPWRLYVNTTFKDVLNWKITEPPIKEYLNQGSFRFFQKLRKGRFSYIDFAVNSFIKKNNQIKQVSLARELESHWKRVPHTLIIGKGGTGKTTNIVKIWEEYITELNNWSKPIPIYITLSDYNQTDYDRNFIIYQIGEHYLGLNHLSDDYQNQMLAAFQKPIIDKDGKYVPSFVLLLDGIDEITVDYEQLMDEIEDLSTYKGLQIVITNTHNLEERWADSFNKIKLVPPQITFTEDFINFKGAGLEKLLRNPMMKQLYDEADEVISRHLDDGMFEFKLPMTRRGELMWNYFEVELVKHYELYETIEEGNFLYARYRFLQKHLLPYIAYLMAKDGLVYYDEDQMQVAIQTASEAIYQRYFLKIYKEYRRYFPYFDLYADSWIKEEERFELLTVQLSSNFVMFVQDGEKYQFTHQLYRDFLAAVHVRNDIFISLKRYNLPQTLVERRLPSSDYLWSTLGELEGEHYDSEGGRKAPFAEKTLLEQTIERCRGIYDKKKTGELIWNILNIWKNLRPSLSKLDLSALDLRGVSLNGVKLQDQDHQHQHSARFNQTLINRRVFFDDSERGDVLDVRFSNILTFGNLLNSGYNDTLFFASVSSDCTLKLWDVTSKRCFTIVDSDNSSIKSVDFSKDGRYVVYASEDAYLRLWDLKEGQLVFKKEAHDDLITSVRFSNDGEYVVSASADTTIKVWKFDNEVLTLEKILENNFPTINCVDFSPNGKYIACGTWHREVALWDWKAEKCLWANRKHFSRVTSITFSSDNKYVLSGSSDDTVFEWRVADGTSKRQYMEHHKGVNSVSCHPTEPWLASASGDNNIKIWNRDTGEPVHTMLGHNDYVMTVDFSPDGKYLLSGSNDGMIRLWTFDEDSYQCNHIFDNYNGLFVQGCDFQKLHKDSHLQSPDKKLLKQFGAIFNDEDKRVWEDLTNRLCYVFEKDDEIRSTYT
jgi:WD40 repeat protein